MQHKGDSDSSYGWRTWEYPQRIGKGTERHRNKRTSKDYPNHYIFLDQ